MADTELKVRLQSAYKTEAEWGAINTVPKAGEILYTKTGPHDGYYKIGNGTDTWSDLPYIKPTYDYSEIQPIKLKTFSNVYVSGNSDPAGYLFFMTAKRGNGNYYKPWRLHYKVTAKINNITDGYETSEVIYSGNKSTYYAYSVFNMTTNSSYRPYYQHMTYHNTEAGVNNGYGCLFGLRFHSAYDPTTASHSREITIEILEETNCIIEFLDTPTLYSAVSGTGSTNYVNRYGLDGTTNGLTVSGDRNTVTQDQKYYTNLIAGTNGMKQYSLVMQDSDFKWQSFTTDYGTGTSKIKNTAGFKLGNIFYLNTSSNYTNGNSNGNGVVNSMYAATDFRYSTNCGTTLVAKQPVYIKGTYNTSTGLFYLADTWWTQTAPTTEDGYLYIFIGIAYNTYQLDFEGNHPLIFYYKDNALRLFSSSDATKTTSGLMSASDKTKLDGIDTGANNYTLPAATSSALGGVKSGTDISVDASGNVSVVDNSHKHTIANVTNLQSSLDAKAPLASPALTGTPTAPTATAGTNTTQIATTAFVKTAVDNATNNIEIGGRNLLTSINPTTETSKTIASTGSSYMEGLTYTITTINGCNTYTVSFEAKSNVDGTTVRCYWYSPNTTTSAKSNQGITSTSTDGNCQIVLTTEWKRYWVTWTQSATDVVSKHLIIGRVFKPTEGSVTCTYRAPKFEIGNEATDWTPAPEDLVSSLSLSGSTLAYKNPMGTQLGTVTLSKSNVGLGNVDNTSDANKPISTATQTALDGKIPLAGTTYANANTSSFSFTNAITGNLIFSNTGDTSGVWRGIGGVNGGNDAWVIRGYQTANNIGNLEIAVGDDGNNEGIYVRQYTSGGYKLPLFNKPGTDSGLTYRELILMAPGTGDSTFPANVNVKGILSIPGPDKLTHTVNVSSVYTPTEAWTSATPFPLMWHDVLAFCRVGTPTYYTTTDGSTWTTATLNKNLFAHKDYQTITVLSETIQGSRWEWNNSGYAWSTGHWLKIGVCNNPTGSPVCYFNVTLEQSSDGETWSSMGSITKYTTAYRYFFMKVNNLTQGRFRITITKHADSASAGTLAITSIQLLSNRAGAQGYGPEFSFPYDWDGNRNMTLPATFKANSIIVSTSFTTTNGKVSGLANGNSQLYSNGFAISNPTTSNDQGWIRVLGTGESDTVFEIATGDDGGTGEEIVVRQYNGSNAVAKEAKLLGKNGVTTFPVSVTAPEFIGALSGNATSSNFTYEVKQIETYNFSNRSTSANNITSNNNGGLRVFLATSSMTTANGKPDNDAHIIHLDWDYGSTYAVQLAVSNYGALGRLASRAQKADGTWTSWSYAYDTAHKPTGTDVGVFQSLSSKNLNEYYDSGFYNLPGGTASNTPTGYAYGQALVLSYRKHIGNSTPDYAAQIYLHNGGTNGNRMFYRTSGSTSWSDWQQIVHSNVNTGAGSTSQPVYLDTDGTLKVATKVAQLNDNGFILTSQLPSFVDDVIEGYYYNNKMYKESGHTTEITGETNKIYVDLSTNKTYRWGGSGYVEISQSLALGETSSTAYRGDRGKTAYDHSQTTSGNPHNVNKNDVGLGNVENKSSATIRGELTSSNVTTALGFTPVNKAGDTVTGALTVQGTLTLSASKTTDAGAFAATAGTYALNLNNSNIIGVNGIYMADESGNAQEGINFYRSSTVADTIWANAGVLYFTPNRTLGTNGTSYTVIHSNIINSYLKPENFQAGYLESRVYYNTHPENNGGIIPFIYNDLAFLTRKGGSYSFYTTTSSDFTPITLSETTAISTDLWNAFDGSPSYVSINRASTDVCVIDLTLHRTFTYGNIFYIDFGAAGWRAKNITVLVMNSTVDTAYVQKGSVTNWGYGHWYLHMSHSTTNSSGTTVRGFNKMRIILTNFPDGTQNRIAQIGLINYGSSGASEGLVSRGGSEMYGHLTPHIDKNVNLGSSSKRWGYVYSNYLYLSGAASATMTAASTNPKIVFSENGGQEVSLIYTDFDTYRAPAGLKVIGGTSATPAWFEVEGDIYERGTKLSSKYSPLAGSTSLTTLASTITLGNGSGATIDQNSATYRQRIEIIDDSTEHTAVFKFSQSSNSGSSYTNLMEIRDDGNVVATTFTGNLVGHASLDIPLTGSTSITGTLQTTGNLYTRGTSETSIRVGYKTEDTERWFYLWGNNSTGTRGIYDTKKGYVIQVTDTTTTFTGNLTGTASALTNFKVTTTTNLGIDAPGTNAIGYVSGLTAANWNYQRTDGALYTQFYSANWIHEIFGDYRTGQLSVRGKNNGTWQSWRRILDETNYSTIIDSRYVLKTGDTMTGHYITSGGDFVSENTSGQAHVIARNSGTGNRIFLFADSLSGNVGLVSYSADNTYIPILLRPDNADNIFAYGNWTFAGNLISNLSLKTSYNLSAADNGVSTTQYPTTFNILDSANRIIARLEGIVYADGNTGSFWYVQNYNTSGERVGIKGISMVMDKNGNLTYSVSDPGKFREATQVPTMTTETYPALRPTNGVNNWIKIGTANDSYGLLPSQSGSLGSGHNYLGTSTWYWKAAYLQWIYSSMLKLEAVASDEAITIENNRLLFGNTNATTEMIRFYGGADAYGHGIVIGGGGATIIGGGESASACKSSVSANDERMIVANDGAIEFYSNCQNGTSTANIMTLAGGALAIRNNNLTKGTNPSGETNRTIVFTDKSGYNSVAGNVLSIWYGGGVTAAGIAYSILRQYKYASNNSDYTQLSINYPASGTPYVHINNATLDVQNNIYATSSSGEIQVMARNSGSGNRIYLYSNSSGTVGIYSFDSTNTGRNILQRANNSNAVNTYGAWTFNSDLSVGASKTTAYSQVGSWLGTNGNMTLVYNSTSGLGGGIYFGYSGTNTWNVALQHSASGWLKARGNFEVDGSCIEVTRTDGAAWVRVRNYTNGYGSIFIQANTNGTVELSSYGANGTRYGILNRANNAGTVTAYGNWVFGSTTFHDTSIYLRNNDLTRGTNPSSEVNRIIWGVDKSGNGLSALYLGGVTATGNSYSILRAYRYDSTASTFAQILVLCPPSGSSYVETNCDLFANGNISSNISSATSRWVRAKNSTGATYIYTNTYGDRGVYVDSGGTTGWLIYRPNGEAGVTIPCYLTIANGYQIGIGSASSTTSEFCKVWNNKHQGSLIADTSGNLGVWSDTANKWAIRMTSSGTVNTNVSSDIRMKNVIEIMPNEEALVLLRNIDIINYTYKNSDDQTVYNGISAQQLRDVLIKYEIGYRNYLLINSATSTEMYYDLNTPEDNISYGIDYGVMVPILWKGWQVLDNTISAHEDRLTKLEKENKELREKVTMLESKLRGEVR